VRSVLVRRPSRPSVPEQLRDESGEAFFLGESAAIIDALPHLIDGETLWVNHPDASRLAKVKLRQLTLARARGLSVPATLVTNSPGEAFTFYKAHAENIICKPLSSTPIRADGSKFIFTHALQPGMSLADFDDIAFGSSVLQVRVAKQSDVRTAVIGEKMFGCEILSQQDIRAETDWRAVPIGLDHRAIPVPDDVGTQLQALRVSLGLAAMHCDFAIEHATGQWWFLEANPNGQWLWIELAIGAQISDALAELLARGRVI